MSYKEEIQPTDVSTFAIPHKLFFDYRGHEFRFAQVKSQTNFETFLDY
jgi:hypothetical protein